MPEPLPVSSILDEETQSSITHHLVKHKNSQFRSASKKARKHAHNFGRSNSPSFQPNVSSSDTPLDVLEPRTERNSMEDLPWDPTAPQLNNQSADGRPDGESWGGQVSLAVRRARNKMSRYGSSDGPDGFSRSDSLLTYRPGVGTSLRGNSFVESKDRPQRLGRRHLHRHHRQQQQQDQPQQQQQSPLVNLRHSHHHPLHRFRPGENKSRGGQSEDVLIEERDCDSPRAPPSLSFLESLTSTVTETFAGSNTRSPSLSHRSYSDRHRLFPRRSSSTPPLRSPPLENPFETPSDFLRVLPPTPSIHNLSRSSSLGNGPSGNNYPSGPTSSSSSSSSPPSVPSGITSANSSPRSPPPDLYSSLLPSPQLRSLSSLSPNAAHRRLPRVNTDQRFIDSALFSSPVAMSAPNEHGFHSTITTIKEIPSASSDNSPFILPISDRPYFSEPASILSRTTSADDASGKSIAESDREVQLRREISNQSVGSASLAPLHSIGDQTVTRSGRLAENAARKIRSIRRVTNVSKIDRLLYEAGQNIDVEEGNVVWVRLWENQRGILFFGTPRFSANILFPLDPAPFTRPGNTRQECQTPYNLKTYQLPDGTWKWASDWMVNMKRDGETDEKGWEYNSIFQPHGWHCSLPWHGWKGWVRRREWIRLRVKPNPCKQIEASPVPVNTFQNDNKWSDSPFSPIDPARVLATRFRTNTWSGVHFQLEEAIKVLAGKRVDRERLEVLSDWLEGGDRIGGLRWVIEHKFPKLLRVFTYDSYRSQAIDLVRRIQPRWTFTLEDSVPSETVADTAEPDHQVRQTSDQSSIGLVLPPS